MRCPPAVSELAKKKHFEEGCALYLCGSGGQMLWYASGAAPLAFVGLSATAQMAWFGTSSNAPSAVISFR